MASDEIFDVRYEVDRPGSRGMPAVDAQYEFTSGVLSNDGKDVEFRIDVDVMRGQYFVNPTELLELKVRAAKLFAGIEGKTLLAASERAKARLQSHCPTGLVLTVGHGGQQLRVRDRRSAAGSGVFY